MFGNTRISLALLSFLIVLLATPATILRAEPGSGPNQQSGGLPPPSIESAAALNKALAELDRAPTTIVAEVGDRTVTSGDIAESIRQLPRISASIPFQQLYQAALTQTMQVKALAARASALGIDKGPAVQHRIKNATDSVLADELLRRSLAQNTTETVLRNVYDHMVANKTGPDEVDARLIVVDDKDLASSLIRRVGAGESFDALARQFSKDGTAANGGDLGFVRLDMLAPEIGSVVFALDVGQITAYPVHSGNLWYVIRVESRRQSAPPTFEDARFALEQDVIRNGIPDLKKQALKEATVKYYGPLGKSADGK
jgi:peptidyl-prolyl cis-trans isomerase C